ncbi:MAG: hypothetical protein OQK82_04330, partial [Candidatus Pacearchaeota archaeon]|nr:hypothetical protein [Candidatus Pacearchaeota archaeon]
MRALVKSDFGFIFPKIESNSEEKSGSLWIDTEFIENSKKGVLRQDFCENSVENFAKMFVKLYSLVSGVRGASLVGMIDKAVREGERLKEEKYMILLDFIKGNYNEIIKKIDNIEDKVFVHGDVFWKNLICDNNDNFVGFWDFGHSGMSIVEADFRQLPCFLGKCFSDFIKEYENFSCRKINKDILIFLSICRFLELVYHYKIRIKDSESLDKIEKSFEFCTNDFGIEFLFNFF